MRKLLYTFACVLMVFAMPSCSLADDGTAAEQTIVGSWKSTKCYCTAMENGQLVSSGTEYYDDNDYMLWTFRADGSFVDVTIEEGESYQWGGTWDVTPDKLYMNYMGESYKWIEVFNITKLTSTTLVVNFTMTEVEADGTTWSYHSEYTFTKQK